MRKKTTINERIVFYCKANRIKQVDLERAGYASKQSINNIWHGRQKPACEFLERFISDNENLNARWLLSGIGNMMES
ncbi:MAG: hypothetical protein ACK5KL_08400 [Dysgonomonas sp.]